NPIAIKIGKNTDFAKLRQIVSILNPENDRGKIILTSRFGVGNSAKFLAPIIEDMKSSRLNVIWCCDPMHGNTKKLENGLKTRNFCDILAEFREFSEVCGSANVYVGGIHIEATAEDVTECCDEEISLGDLNKNFKSLCDPRLNYRQSLELINKIKFVLS
ncbi:MAG: 3-deoxy-7-phosphoheptulonate synthase, partial [Rickettsiales bacterium]|nr:3-deoxy-7-phosphoheptulonate synthase [Rickettsiales bacterium]